MRTNEPNVLMQLASDLEIEIDKLEQLSEQIWKLQQNLVEAPTYAGRKT